VVFVTGVCPQKCFYCPISVERGGNDVQAANERPVSSVQDIIEEAKAMDAKGASITGGEPLLVLDRVVSYIKALKKEFGPEFHIHLYTYGDLAGEKEIKALEEAGLDEIRFHLLGENKERIFPALKSSMSVGVEVPAIPSDSEELFDLVDFVIENKIEFINLNELEFSDSNWDQMVEKKCKQRGEHTYAVEGSMELAIEVLSRFEKTDVKAHFCSVKIKNGVQLTNRLMRRARNTKKPFETVTNDGFKRKGTVEGEPENVKKAWSEIKKGPKVFFNEEKQRIECDLKTAVKIAKKFSALDLQAFDVLEYPVFNAWDFEKRPVYPPFNPKN
ncbi:MAG: radical SAM protein, partial [Candidatus Diapherotrites archaeon]|nr:radical SAM protein [Candidatus Diapherotrites archaeon]